MPGRIPRRSDFLRDDVGGAVGAAKHDVGFVVANDLLGGGIEGEGAAEAIGSVGQVDEGAGDVGFLDGGMDVFGAAAANAIDKIRKVIASGFAVRAGLHLVAEPRFVTLVAVNSQIALRPVEDISDGVALGIARAERRLLSTTGGHSVDSRLEPRRRDGIAAVRAGADFGFVVGDPVADFELHHFAFAIGSVEIKRGAESVGRFLIIVEHEMVAHGGDGNREADAQSPASDIDFVNGLVADFAVAGVPNPVPVVVKAIFRERLERSGAGPEIVVDAGRNGFFGGVADGAAPLVTDGASEIDVTDGAVAEVMNRFDHSGIGARLAAVLADAIVFFYGADKLAAFEPIVRARLFHVNVLAGLTAPDGDQRMPVIGSGDGDGVDFLVLEKLAHIDVGFRARTAQFFDVAETLVEDVFVDIAEGGELDAGDVREAADVILATATCAADGDADAIIRAEDFAAERERRRANRDGFSRGLKKVSPLDFHESRLSRDAQCARRIVYRRGGDWREAKLALASGQLLP